MSCYTLRIFFAASCLALSVALPVGATDDPPPAGDDNTVLLSNSLAAVTWSDFYAELERMPPDIRGNVELSRERINKLLDNLLLDKSLAAQARQSKLDETPEIRRQLQVMTDKWLAQILVQRVVTEAAARFDANEADFEPSARELYKLNPENYTEPAAIKASHVLISLKDRSREEALKRAQEVRDLALAGSPFDELVLQYSDDPSAKQNKGDLGKFGRGKMVKAFEDAALALDKPGDVSMPVETQFGFHIILLNGKSAARLKPYEEVRALLMAGLKNSYVNQSRIELLSKINADPATAINEAGIDSLKKSFDFKAAIEDARKKKAPK